VEHRQGENEGHPDGEQNVRVHHDPSILTLNSALTPLVRHTIKQQFKEEGAFSLKVADLDRDQRPEILAFTEKVDVFQYQRASR